MTSRVITRTLLALTAVSLSIPAMAQAPRAAGAETQKGAGSWMLQRYDADGDGAISLQEFQAAGDALFAQLDADGDGRINAEEFAAFERRWSERARHGQRAEQRAERLERRPEGGGGRFAKRSEAHERSGHRGRDAHSFARMDADGDGYVSRAEFEDARMARFNALDVNGNGVIDADELATHKHRKAYGKRDRGGAAASE
jgi:Ca2+-binding EF-hand superfamily protein